MSTGKERDSESGLDYFGARYYGAALGRFTSPDEPLVDQDPADPQSWNLYGYVRNNPLSNIDQTGRSCITLDNGSQADNSDGQGCSGAGVSTGNPNDPSTLNQGQVNAQVTAQQGSWLAAVGTNAFISVTNAANSYFSFIAPNSQLLSQTPTGQGAAAQIGAGIGLAATFIGPGGEAEGAAQGASRLWSRGVKNAFPYCPMRFLGATDPVHADSPRRLQSRRSKHALTDRPATSASIGKACSLPIRRVEHHLFFRHLHLRGGKQHAQ